MKRSESIKGKRVTKEKKTVLSKRLVNMPFQVLLCLFCAGKLVCFLHRGWFLNPVSDRFFDGYLHVSFLESVLFGDCLSELLFEVAVHRKVDFDVFLVFLFHG